MFSYGDGMTMSSKKDAIVNMGGFIALRDEALFREASTYNIMFEGFITYGGMSGRDMNALAQGLYEGTEFDTLDTRIKQVAYLGQLLHKAGVPLQLPFGGHAIFVDAKRFLPHLPKEQFTAQTLAVELYLEAGIRAVEIGAILADRDPITRENRYPDLELVRLAIPRRTYTNNHMAYVAAALINVWERRDSIKTGLKNCARSTYYAPFYSRSGENLVLNLIPCQLIKLIAEQLSKTKKIARKLFFSGLFYFDLLPILFIA